MIHPTNRAERLRIRDKKNEKKQKLKEPRASRVWHKLTKEQLKQQEIDHDLHQLREAGFREYNLSS